MCRRDGAQCCSAEYLKQVQEKVRKRLEQSLGEEFQDVIDNYKDEIENLMDCELKCTLTVCIIIVTDSSK